MDHLSDAIDAFRRHGGNLAAAAAAFPDAPTPWIDLSTGISPHAYPFAPPASSAFERLPEADREQHLLQAAGQAYGAAAGTAIAAAPGTQILIQLLPLVCPADRVAVVGPTYSEHARCWRRVGAHVHEVAHLEAAGDADVVVVVNPNNPDGRRVAPSALRAFAGHLAARGGLLVVDEAFADLMPGASLIPDGIPDGCLVLRSFGKTYGLAGVRIGFALGAVEVVERLVEVLGPWAVAGPAIAIATQALRDTRWREQMMTRLEDDARRLDGHLKGAGLGIVGGTPLFRLAETPDAEAWFRRLAGAGILVRPFAAEPSWLRFGLPRDAEWDRVERALASGA